MPDEEDRDEQEQQPERDDSFNGAVEIFRRLITEYDETVLSPRFAKGVKDMQAAINQHLTGILQEVSGTVNRIDGDLAALKAQINGAAATSQQQPTQAEYQRAYQDLQGINVGTVQPDASGQMATAQQPLDLSAIAAANPKYGPLIATVGTLAYNVAERVFDMWLTVEDRKFRQTDKVALMQQIRAEDPYRAAIYSDILNPNPALARLQSQYVDVMNRGVEIGAKGRGGVVGLEPRLERMEALISALASQSQQTSANSLSGSYADHNPGRENDSASSNGVAVPMSGRTGVDSETLKRQLRKLLFADG